MKKLVVVSREASCPLMEHGLTRSDVAAGIPRGNSLHSVGHATTRREKGQADACRGCQRLQVRGWGSRLPALSADQ
jgi:hypothetical protein